MMALGIAFLLGAAIVLAGSYGAALWIVANGGWR